jgi:hypothetical protein
MLASMDLIEKIRRYQDYIHALEDEGRKIEVFQRELPLCLHLVSQGIFFFIRSIYSFILMFFFYFANSSDFNLFNVAIENMKNQIDNMASQETTSDGPVLEEFIPLKPSLSSSEEESAHEVKKGANMEISEKKADWLQSVQLWNQDPDSSFPPSPVVKLIF